MKIIFIICLFVVCFCLNIKEKSFINIKNIQKADLILREGNGIDSAFIKEILHSNYTHLGIISSTKPVKILHATYDDLGQNGVVEFSLEDFLKGSKKIKIIRLNLKDKEKEILINNLYKKLGYKFKLNAKKNNLYCTTFIQKELYKLNQKKLKMKFLNLPFNSGFYLLPDSFLELPHEDVYTN